MEFRQIKYFYYVCKYMNFTTAAKEIGISQPNLTTQIKHLEKELHVQLFNRTKPLALTNGGEILYKYSGKIFDNVLNIEREINDLLNQKKCIKIGVPNLLHPYFCNYFYSDNFQGFFFELFEDKTNNLIKKLNSGELDFCISPAVKNYKKIKLRKCLFKKYSKSKSVSDDVFSKVVIPCDTVYSYYIENSNLSFMPDVRTDNLMSIKYLLDKNYVAYLPDMIDLDCYVSVLDDHIPIEINLLYKEEYYMNHSIRKFLERIK